MKLILNFTRPHAFTYSYNIEGKITCWLAHKEGLFSLTKGKITWRFIGCWFVKYE